MKLEQNLVLLPLCEFESMLVLLMMKESIGTIDASDEEIKKHL